MSTASTQALLAQSDHLRSLALSMVGREDLADDLLQDVWVTALTSPPRPGWDPRSWLNGVARNIARQRRREASRRQRREALAARPEELPATGDTAGRLDLMRMLVDAVQGLDAPYRDVVVLRFFDALPPREIAQRLGLSVETVRTRLRRGLERLRVELDTTHGDREMWTAVLLPLTALPTAAAATATASLSGLTLWLMNTKILFAGLVLAAVVLSVMFAIPPAAPAEPAPGAGSTPANMVAQSESGAAQDQTDSVEPREAVVVAKSLRVFGNVRKNSDVPLGGARVRIRVWRGYESKGDPHATGEAIADARGRFEWRTPHPEGTVLFEVECRRRDSLPAKREQLVVAGQDPRRVWLRCYELDCEVTGRVTDVRGNPIEGALVSLFGQTGVTAKDGTYRARATTGFKGVTAEVYARGYVLSNQTIKPERRGLRQVDFELRRGFAVSGRVTTEDGAPVVGARFHESWRTRDHEGITDRDGRYTLTCLAPAQEARLNLSHPKFLSAQATVKAADGVVTKDFVLRRGALIRGSVVDSEGLPVPGAVVDLYRSPASGSAERSAIVRDDGRYEMLGVEPGVKKFVVSRRGFAGQTMRGWTARDAPGSQNVNFRLMPGTTVRGVVTDADQNPLPRVTLFVTDGRDRRSTASVGKTTRTDARGRFQIPDLPPGPVTIRATGSGFLDSYRLVERTANADLRIQMKPSGQLAGQVFDKATGAPVTDFRVRFVTPVTQAGDRHGSGYNAVWSSTGTVFSSATGEWNTGTETLEPGTVFGVEITAAGYAAFVVPRIVVACDPVPVRIALERGRLLEGSVVAARDGQPVAGAVVRVLMPNAAPYSRVAATAEDPLRAVTDDRGVFRFTEVPDGPLRLQIRHASFPIFIDGPFEERGARSVRLRRGAVIRGVVLSDAGDPVPNAQVSLSPQSREGGADYRSGRTDARGAFVFDRLPEGAFTVAWMQYNGNTGVARRSYLARVKSGEEVEVRMAKPNSGSTVSGRVSCTKEIPPHCYVTLIPSGDPAKPADAKAGSRPKVSALRNHVGFIEDGQFTIRGVEAGSFLIYASHLGPGVSIQGMRKIEVVKGRDVQADVTVTIR